MCAIFIRLFSYWMNKNCVISFISVANTSLPPGMSQALSLAPKLQLYKADKPCSWRSLPFSGKPYSKHLEHACNIMLSRGKCLIKGRKRE